MAETMEWSTEQMVSQRAGCIVSDMDGEKVMLSIERGKYYNLGEIGGRIWDLISVPVSIGKLVNLLTQEYAIGAEECEKQVMHFLSQLTAEELITVSRQAS
ncbi:lasso peptide biosynthesis PqqD family chaperone [Cohnella sp. GCM10020058]|uniref:lasso peptide biosynthesis PqqD family chaperone n=1 Tax=Cohnella sp. GCM10020058 TaxID=3317330 RepID=UPI0036341AA9